MLNNNIGNPIRVFANPIVRDHKGTKDGTYITGGNAGVVAHTAWVTIVAFAVIVLRKRGKL